jgi:hypothetical protein
LVENYRTLCSPDGRHPLGGPGRSRRSSSTRAPPAAPFRRSSHSDRHGRPRRHQAEGRAG